MGGGLDSTPRKFPLVSLEKLQLCWVEPPVLSAGPQVVRGLLGMRMGAKGLRLDQGHFGLDRAWHPGAGEKLSGSQEELGGTFFSLQDSELRVSRRSGLCQIFLAGHRLRLTGLSLSSLSPVVS